MYAEHYFIKETELLLTITKLWKGSLATQD